MNVRTPSEHTLTSWDGLKLFYRAWLPASPTDKAVLLFHRGHEHSGRWEGIVEQLVPEGVAVFAWDARGNGRSDGERDDAENFACYAKDADLFARHIASTHGIPLSNMAAVGHSVGGGVLAAWVHDYAPRLKAMVLATPAFRIRLYVPLAIPSLRLASRLGIMKRVPSYVKARVLTHDPEEIQRHEQDTLITHSISTRILLDLYDTSTRLIEDAGAIRVPTLVLVAGSDWVVQKRAEEAFFQRLGSTEKVIERFPGMFHDLYHEKDRALPLGKTREFLARAFAKTEPLPSAIDGDKRGYTKEEFDALSRPLPAGSLRQIQYSVLGFLMRTLGRWSDGISLGWESGFNSGRTLDYVYRNQAHGFTPLGRIIDRSYLDGIGWKGIRVRKVLLERTLQGTLERVHKVESPVHMVDIATGAGRYMLETLAKLPTLKVTAELRDREPKNLEEGRKIAATLGLSGVTFVQGDAFDRASLAALSPRPRIAVVSGLYELFPDNGRILASLRGLAEAVPEGGYLVYTNQPWHPQMELIARLLCDWDGKPWIMRRRTQGEMDDLVREAGFEKEGMDIDPWGIFTVSVARRLGK